MFARNSPNLSVIFPHLSSTSTTSFREIAPMLGALKKALCSKAFFSVEGAQSVITSILQSSIRWRSAWSLFLQWFAVIRISPSISTIET